MVSCLERFNANLLKFEKYSIKVKEVKQGAESEGFWSLLMGKPRGAFPGTSRLLVPDHPGKALVYGKNIEWSSWFCYLNEERSSNVTRSSRSKQSLYSYAEENDKRNKCVLFVFPDYQEPFYFFDLDDLQNDGYSLLVDPLQKVNPKFDC